MNGGLSKGGWRHGRNYGHQWFSATAEARRLIFVLNYRNYQDNLSKSSVYIIDWSSWFLLKLNVIWFTRIDCLLNNQTTCHLLYVSNLGKRGSKGEEKNWVTSVVTFSLFSNLSPNFVILLAWSTFYRHRIFFNCYPIHNFYWWGVIVLFITMDTDVVMVLNGMALPATDPSSSFYSSYLYSSLLPSFNSSSSSFQLFPSLTCPYVVSSQTYAWWFSKAPLSTGRKDDAEKGFSNLSP